MGRRQKVQQSTTVCLNICSLEGADDSRKRENGKAAVATPINQVGLGVVLVFDSLLWVVNAPCLSLCLEEITQWPCLLSLDHGLRGSLSETSVCALAHVQCKDVAQP